MYIRSSNLSTTFDVVEQCAKDEPVSKKKTMDDDETVHLGLRIPKRILRDIDAFLKQLKKENPGLLLNRSAAIRTLVAQALDERSNGKACDAMQGTRGCRLERGHEGEHRWSP